MVVKGEKEVKFKEEYCPASIALAEGVCKKLWLVVWFTHVHVPSPCQNHKILKINKLKIKPSENLSAIWKDFPKYGKL